MDRIRDLCELARDMNESVESLIRLGANGELAIYVIADDWSVRSSDKTEDTIRGEVFLVPEDLLQSMNAQCTRVRAIRRELDDEVLTLNEPVDVMRGVHFVTAHEAERFCREHALLLKSGSETPPYLNPNHDFYASELGIAVKAWMAIFADGGFEPRGKTSRQHIELWLTRQDSGLSESARERIATLVNPDPGKKGGSPQTPSK